MTAALYALRAGKSVLVLEKETFGGQIAIAPRVENFPSIKQISGAEFSENLMEQIADLGAEIELEDVESIVKQGNHFVVTTDYNTYKCYGVIIATGVEHKQAGVEGEHELVGNGVSYCAVCDGSFYKGQKVAVLGSGNSALQYSMLLAGYCEEVFICTRYQRWSGDKQLVDRLPKFPNITVRHNSILKSFEVNGGELSGLNFISPLDNEESYLAVKACFVAVGHKPNNAKFKSIIQLDEDGYVIADENCTTNVEGIFVAGDCRTKKIRQLTTAVGDGAVAGMAVCTYVDNLVK